MEFLDGYHIVKINNPDPETLLQGVDKNSIHANHMQYNRLPGDFMVAYIPHPMHPYESGKLLAIMPHEYVEGSFPEKLPDVNNDRVDWSE